MLEMVLVSSVCLVMFLHFCCGLDSREGDLGLSCGAHKRIRDAMGRAATGRAL